MPDVSKISPDAQVAYQRTQETRHGAPSRAARHDDEGPGAERGQRLDSVSLSPGGQELSRLTALVKAAPEERKEVVARLRLQVEDGTYQPPDETTLAEDLLRSG